MNGIRSGLIAVMLSLAVYVIPTASVACGGFFCTTVPINQAAEQIVFRQEDNMVTAMVRILYAGNAEDFSWVVPVPETPEISLGANNTFTELDFATQPQFLLQREGQVCSQDDISFTTDAGGVAESESEEADEGVTIEEELQVGPFDIDIVSSDNPDDMSIWLQDNGYLLSDRGTDLIEPYVLAGMKFVALKLRSGESSGSIQPLIMRYPSDKPEVPIRLTAVAAEEDMGVLVWVVNDARAIPENYEHVTPNYTRLDWFAGSANAYASYQSLITDAMNETESGQGFATDYAGSFTQEMQSQLTDAADVENNLAALDETVNDAVFLSNSLFLTTDPSGALASLQNILPLPDGFDANTYFDTDQLASIFTTEELAQARTDVRASIVERELEPIANAVELLPAGSYLTRLFTTLSADEMTLDPSFNFNSQMPEQPLTREARVVATCENEVSRWNLTLGSGTGREGETVLEVEGQPIPFGGGTITPVDDQPAAYLRERTSAEAMPELIEQADVSLLQVNADNTVVSGFIEADDDSGFLGSAGFIWFLIASLTLAIRQGSSRWTILKHI